MPLSISSTLAISDDELDFQFARSSGPGGQNVNKVSTKAILRWNATTSPSLSAAVRARFLARYASRILSDGSIQIARDESRSQLRNRAACLDELASMIAAVLVAPKKRKATRPTRGATERRLAEKKRRSDTKRTRGGRADE
ncbi:MAG: aminoacyl-tRNA hydrolase [Deltaproteobacteria bacterium]|nr:aminoacyl-tRNA hydrolase [Deltaproteobacteria bacterium]